MTSRSNLTAESTATTRMLPHAMPAGSADRLLLFAIRRMAQAGIDDAYASNAMLNHFGRGFRRPLVLLRATIAEVSRVSARSLMVAPCCCPRITADEHGLLSAIAGAVHDPRDAHDRLARHLGVRHCHVAGETMRALDDAFRDLGHPLAVVG
ncbi:DUF6628 family protein [Sphingomonas montana]|uniref:DUF6628 family protein n=1 Tax=Sphingomonas montana TaxID=1843236 RepID=UPI001F0ADA76|nr:DUF6628 family protein [Sphingomonas montana]